MRRGLVGVLVLVSLVAGACTGINPTTSARANGVRNPYTYVALGENGASGFHHGHQDLRSRWTQVFYRSALRTGGVLYDLSTGGETVAEVLDGELPQALALHPELVSVWLSTADIVAGTSPPVYEHELEHLVGAFTRTGATVLLANAPPPDVVSALATCGPGPSACAGRGGPVPQTPALATAVSAYNGAIASVARATGADLVDIYSALERAARDGGVKSLLSPDGTALSGSGATVVVHAFDAQVPSRFRPAR